MGMGIAGLMRGAGAGEGLQTLLKQRLLEREMALRERAQMAQEQQHAAELSMRGSEADANRDLLAQYRNDQLGQQAYQQEGMAVDRLARQMPYQATLEPQTAERLKAFGYPVTGPSQEELSSPLANEALPDYQYAGNAPEPKPSKLMSPEEYGQWKQQQEDSARITAKYRPAPTPQPTLTPEGMALAAEWIAKRGEVPALGMGAAGRVGAFNAAAEKYPGLNPASASADFSADKMSLGNMQKMRDAVGSFEQTAGKNLDLFINQAKQVVDSGSPMVNTPWRQFERQAAGNPQLAGMLAARRVAINEIAKVTSNPTLAGQLSDSARHEVESFIPENATLAQTLAVADVLRQDMRNRMVSMDDQLAAIKARMGGGNPGAAPASEPSGVVEYVRDPKTGKLIRK